MKYILAKNCTRHNWNPPLGDVWINPDRISYVYLRVDNKNVTHTVITFGTGLDSLETESTHAEIMDQIEAIEERR